MSTHFQINNEDPERLRSLLEPCLFCGARAGEPCRLVIDRTKRGEYICPDNGCDRLYGSASAAMSCAGYISAAVEG